MKVPLVSAKRVLADVARNNGGRLPTAYHDDILEWLPEGIDMLSRTGTLATTSTPSLNDGGALITKNHVVKIPCDLVAILAIEDQYGNRLPEGGDITDITRPTTAFGQNGDVSRASVFEVNPLVHQTADGVPTTEPGTSIPIYGTDLELVTSTSQTAAYYKVSGNCIQTSFETGFVKIHYLQRPLDKDGYPMIPDNQNFKTALYWYVMRMLIGAGYEHPVFKYKDCDIEFEKFAARAIGELTYPSLDEYARINRSFVRLVPPYHFADDFFINSEQTQQIVK